LHLPPPLATCGTTAGGGLAINLASTALACRISVTNNTANAASGGGGGGISLNMPTAASVLDFQNRLEQVGCGAAATAAEL
jgi:hypothetical protein